MSAQHEQTKTKDSTQEMKSNYLQEDKLKKIRQCQQEIFETVQISPSVKKIIHELITEENLDKVKQKIIELFRN